MDAYLPVGEVLRPHGVRGEVKIRSLADSPEILLDLESVSLQTAEGWRVLPIQRARVREGFVYFALEGVDSMEAAEALRNQTLYVPRDALGELPEDTVYIADLIGCTAVDEEGHQIGELREVLQNGPTDVYVFRTPKGELLAPALKAVFPEVDPEQKIISVCRARLEEVAVRAD